MVTKDEFVEAYKKFPPSKFEMFFLKHISMHSLRDNMLTTFLIVFMCFIPFIAAIFFNTIQCHHFLKHLPTYVYIAIVTMFGIYWWTVSFLKRRRFKKIRKYLNVTLEEYHNLINIYFYDRYPSTEKFIRYNSKKS